MKRFHLTVVILVTALALIGSTGLGAQSYDDSSAASTISSEVVGQNKKSQLPELGKAGSPLLLEETIAFALAKNPQIAAARSRWEAALSRPKVVSSLPDPAVGVTYFGEQIETRNGPIRGGITLSQRFPWLGKLKTKSKIAQSKAGVFEERYESTRLVVTSRVKQTYFELYWITKAIVITRSNVGLLKQLEKVAQIKYATGKVPQQDVLKAQVEISKLQNDLDTFVEMKTTVEAKLNALLGRRPGAPLGDPEGIEFERLTLDLDSLYKLAKASSPKLSLHRQLIEKAEGELKLAKLDYFPDFAMGVQYQQIDLGAPMAPQEGLDAWSVMFSMSLPIWWGKKRAGVSEAETKTLSERFAYSDRENMLLFEVKDSYFRINTAQRQIILYKESLIPRAGQSLRVSEESYKADKTDFLNLIDSQRMLLHFQLAYERALADFQQNLAGLEEIVGAKLPESKSK